MAYLSQFSKAAPYGVVVSIGILALIISLFFLPDTKGVDLGDSVREAEERKTSESSEKRSDLDI